MLPKASEAQLRLVEKLEPAIKDRYAAVMVVLAITEAIESESFKTKYGSCGVENLEVLLGDGINEKVGEEVCGKQ